MLDVRSIEVLRHLGLPRVVEVFYVDGSITQIYVKNPGAMRLLAVFLTDGVLPRVVRLGLQVVKYYLAVRALVEYPGVDLYLAALYCCWNRSSSVYQ